MNVGIVLAVMFCGAAAWTRPKCGTPNVGQDIITEWGKTIDPSKPVLPEYPRPQMTRPIETYKNLNGLWEWQNSSAGEKVPFGKTLGKEILVPFPVEACLSGIGESHANMMYRTTFDKPFRKDLTLLHFGAVDWQTQVYVNGKYVGNHTGGYDGFSFDITTQLKDTNNELFVVVFDPSDAGPQPMGKQRVLAISEPQGDHYTPTSGIWQTVWLENVNANGYISNLAIRTDMEAAYVTSTVMGGEQPVGLTVEVHDGTKVVASEDGIAGKEVKVSIPNPKLWSPKSPFLYTITVYTDSDTVKSYCGLRVLELGTFSGSPNQRLMLNKEPIFAAGWLDQSWWPDGQYTAPTDAALASDITAVKTFGLNMVRLHQKINPERWYYAADVAGVMVFQDAVQHFGENPSVELFKQDWKAAILGRGNHPCIVQWDIFNEGDCYKAFDVPDMVKFTRSIDPYRLVDAHSGGDLNAGGDVNDIHTYPYPGEAKASPTQYGMIGEFGGIGAFISGKEWVPDKCHTYLKAGNATDEANKYIAMAATIAKYQKDKQVSASVYTQITDVELECDGFLNYDRTNKFTKEDTTAIAAANGNIIDGATRRASTTEV
eukprot:m.202098 g.202098  ORF g.202098 m.202098 type:complete len:600 (-) comp18815_c0_seq2:222-2021(-)